MTLVFSTWCHSSRGSSRFFSSTFTSSGNISACTNLQKQCSAWAYSSWRKGTSMDETAPLTCPVTADVAGTASIGKPRALRWQFDRKRKMTASDLTSVFQDEKRSASMTGSGK
uniref:(northern house mosquito) hypothetical protein n=1 Tax=Culex pipiens TaxID=7175 RepID=A0A8D8FCE2_CULPI